MNAVPPAPTERTGLVRIAVMAVLLGLVHIGAAAATLESRLAANRASDARIALQASALRETVLITAANRPDHDPDVRASQLGEATRLRHGSGGILALQQQAEFARTRSENQALIATEFELAEAGLQLAILLVALAGLSPAWPMLGRGGLLLSALALLVAVLAGLDALSG